MTVYVMSYFTQASYDAEIDDPSFDECDLSDHGSPQFARIAGKFSEAWLTRCTTPRNEIEDLAGHLMESDEHEDIWAGEAEMWAKTVTQSGIVKFAEDYPRHTVWIMQIKDMT